MLNFFKMDLRRLFKCVSFYVITVLFALLCCIVVYSDSKTIKEVHDGGYKDYRIFYEDETEIPDIYSPNLTFGRYAQNLYNDGTMIVLIIVVISLFICSEYQTGFIKNIARITKFKCFNIASKLCTSFVLVFIMNLIGCSIYFVGIKYIYVGTHVGNLTSAFKYIGIQMLIQMAIVSMLVLISTLFRSKALSITVGIVFIIQMIVWPFLFLVDRFTTADGEELYNYLLSSQRKIIGNLPLHSQVQTAITVGIICLAAFVSLSCYVYRKRDI